MSHLDFANRLAIYGYKKEVEDFDFLLAETWWCDGYEELHKTIETMLHNCLSARSFCNKIRLSTSIPIADHEILLHLTNIRKSGFLKASEPDGS